MSPKKVQNKKKKESTTVINPVWYVVLLATSLRLLSINQSLWLDEATTALVSRLSFSDILVTFGRTDFHPPLYYLFMKLINLVGGSSEIVLRLPSVLAGVLTVYVIYLIGKTLFNKQIGLIASLLLATSPLHIYYSHEARMYSLAALFASLCVYFTLKALNDKETYSWILLSIVIPITVGLDYIAGFILLPLWILIITRNRSSVKHFLISHVPLLVLAALYSQTFVTQLQSGLSVQTEATGWWNILGATDFKSMALVPVKFLIGRISFTNKVLYGGVAVGLLSLTGFLLYKARAAKESVTPFMWLMVPAVTLALIGFVIPAFVYFRLLFCLPALYLLCAIGIHNLKDSLFLPLLSLFLVSNIACSYLYLSREEFQREDWRGLTETVSRESKDKSAVVVFVKNSQMEAYRYYGSPVTPIPGDQFEGNVDTVWLMRYVQDVFDPADNVRMKVESEGYRKETELSFNGIVVWKYNKSE